MRPLRRIVADALLDLSELAESGAKALSEPPEATEGEQIRGWLRSLQGDVRALQDWARLEGARLLPDESPPEDGGLQDLYHNAILAARKAGGGR